MKEVRLDGLRALLAQPTHIVLTNHINPDGDAMGSALGLQILLQKLGHTVTVVVPNQYPNFLHWMPNNKAVVRGDENPTLAAEVIAEAKIIFHLDYNAYSRTGELEEMLRSATAKRVMIDHHRQPEEWPDFIYSDTAMSSTCQMVYEFAEILGWQDKFDADAAACLYTGIITDTGSFRFASATSRTLQVAAILMDIGVKPVEIYDRVFDNSSVSRLKLLGAMLDQMEYFDDKNATLLFLSLKEQQQNNYQRGDSEGFVNYGLSIAGVRFSIFLREDVDMIKISLRSKGDFDVNALSRVKFNGGGHVNAAGGSLRMPLSEALTYARNVINELEKNPQA